MTPELKARQEIDRLLDAAGWQVCDIAQTNIHAARGVAVREFPLAQGHGFADYLLYVDGKAAGVIEAKKAGATLIGVESQSVRYAQGLPASLPAWRRPLPFLYESTGFETHFTNGLDPQPRARSIFAFHRADLLAAWLQGLPQATNFATGEGDYVFNSPSAASSVILGRSSNGRIEWKDASGRTLKELQEREAALA